jgi:hypothetical protein
MAKFCSECGFQLSGSEKFCGSCGKKVINLCPTCGQEWDQAPVAAAPAPTKKVKAVATETITTAKGSFAQTSARVQPIYGPAYEDGKDCTNCGAKGMANKTCKTCESEN